MEHGVPGIFHPKSWGQRFLEGLFHWTKQLMLSIKSSSIHWIKSTGSKGLLPLIWRVCWSFATWVGFDLDPISSSYDLGLSLSFSSVILLSGAGTANVIQSSFSSSQYPHPLQVGEIKERKEKEKENEKEKERKRKEIEPYIIGTWGSCEIDFW